MKHELIQTSDGSTSLYIADLQETYTLNTEPYKKPYTCLYTMDCNYFGNKQSAYWK